MKRLIFSAAIGAVCLFTSCEITMSEEELTKRAAEIHDKVFTIDTHTDTPMQLERREYDLSQRHNSRERYGGKVDFPRMQDGGLDAAFFAIFLGQRERTLENNKKAQEFTLEMFDKFTANMKNYSDVAEIAYSAADGYRIEKERKRAIYIGIENGFAIGTDLKKVEEYYNLGARYITLCHTKNNDICDSSTDSKGEEHNGLSQLGEEVVGVMNRLGMLIDVSHISDKAFYDVIEKSKAPVVASHSSVRALCDHPRNLDDNMLLKLKENGGVIQICLMSSYLKVPAPNPVRDSVFAELSRQWNDAKTTDAEREVLREKWYEMNEKYPRELASVNDVVNHIDYVVKLIGVDYVGIGSDFDGGGAVADCYDVSEMGNITLELVKRGYSDEDIRKIWGGNFMRVFSEVEKLASNN